MTLLLSAFMKMFSFANSSPLCACAGTPGPSDADAEHVLEESTAAVDRFVSEEAVVRIKVGGGGGGNVEDRTKGEGPQQGGSGFVPRLDEDHLRNVLEQVTHSLQYVVTGRARISPFCFVHLIDVVGKSWRLRT